MIELDRVSLGIGYNRKVFLWFCDVVKKRKNKIPKEPKGRAEDGSYCPKRKFGQSWAYTKDNIERENDKDE